MKGLTPICPYCKKFSLKVTGKEIYPHRPDLYKKTFYQCAPCDAYVGCHKNSGLPLGRLANKELRKAKCDAHAAFDPIWQDGHMSRGRAYQSLAEFLGISKVDCHIGMFDVADCEKVVIFANRTLHDIYNQNPTLGSLSDFI